MHDELRELARRHLGRERENHTLDPTELVHDAWMRLIRPDAGEWSGRRQFYALASKTMRSLLVDHARRRNAERRGGGARDLTLRTGFPSDEMSPEIDVVMLDDALARLEEINPDLAQVAEVRLFAGMEMKDVAEHVGVPVRTVERRWRSARVWLTKELRDD